MNMNEQSRYGYAAILRHAARLDKPRGVEYNMPD